MLASLIGLAVLIVSSSSFPMSSTAPANVRRSRRLQNKSPEQDEIVPAVAPPKKKPRRQPKAVVSSSAKTRTSSLPRTLETQILANNSTVHYVLGVDEAGRGPLAGPVVAAAILLPAHVEHGIVDSKVLSRESDREAMFDTILATENVSWAIAVVDAGMIDSINILQATLLGMRWATQVVVAHCAIPGVPVHSHASIQHEGCYVVSSANTTAKKTRKPQEYHALIDGNKVPSDMPCEADSVIKGDGREYSIAAASILAKVTRDRLMHAYHKEYDMYGFDQHKGYPTRAHVEALRQHGPTRIHRRTFAPLKHWEDKTTKSKDKRKK